MTLPPEDLDLIERVLGRDLYHATRTVYDPVSVAKLLAAVRAEAAPVVNERMVERARLALHRVRYERMKRMLNGDRRALGERSPGDPPDMQEDARAALEAALTQPNGGQDA